MRRMVSLLSMFAVLVLCVGCTSGSSTPRPQPVPTSGTPTAVQLIASYAWTLAHERFHFDLKSGVSEEIGTLDVAHDGLDVTTPGSAELEIRHLGSHEWARNAITPDEEPGFSGSPEDSQVWLVIPGAHRDVMSQLPGEFPLAASLTGLDRGGTSVVHRIGAADVHGSPSVGYQWSVTLPAALASVAKMTADSEVEIQLFLDADGRVCEVRLKPIAATGSAAPTGSSSPAPATSPVDLTLTMYDFASAPAITEPPNPITAKQFNAQH